ncbi:MAG: O-antigen ligase family protein [Vulcanimicrobiota bacterium]
MAGDARLERVSSAFFRLIDTLCLGLLMGLVFFPAIPALIYLASLLWGFDAQTLLTGEVTPGKVFLYICAGTDSGAQLASGGSLLRGLGLLALAFWLLLPRQLAAPVRPLARLTLGLGLVGVVGALSCDHPRDALVGWMDLLLPLALAIMAADLGWRERNKNSLLAAFVASLAVVLLVAYISFALGFSPDERMRGSFFHPNMLAAYLLLGLGPLAYMVLAEQGQDRPGQAALAPVLAALLGSLLLTGSRAAWLAVALLAGPLGAGLVSRFSQRRQLWMLGFPLAGGILCLGALLHWWIVLVLAAALPLVWLRHLSEPRKFLPKLIVVLVLAGCFGLGLMTVDRQNSPTNRIEGAISSNSFKARLHFWSASLAIARNHPWLGVGPDGFHRHYPAYQTDIRYFSKFTHSLPMSLLAECGLLFTVPAVAWLWLAGSVLWARAREGDFGLGWAIFWSVAMWLVHACFDVDLQFPALGFTAGLLLGLALAQEPSAEEPAEQEPRSQWSIRPGLLSQYPLAVVAVMLCLVNAQLTFAAHHTRLADLASGVSEYKAAADLYREAMRLDPFDGENYRKLALVAMVAPALEVPDETLEQLSQQALALDPHRPVCHNLRGRVLERLGQDGRPAFRRALELDSFNYPSFYRDLAEAYRVRGQPQVALQLVEQALRRFPDEARTQVQDSRVNTLTSQMAGLYEEQGFLLIEQESTLPASQRAFEQALALEDSANRRFGLAVSLMGQKQFARAAEEFEKVVKLDDSSRQTWEFLGHCYAKLGRLEDLKRVNRSLSTRSVD